MQQSESYSVNCSNISYTADVTLNTRQLDLLTTITKQTLLGCIILFTICLLSFTSCVLIVIEIMFTESEAVLIMINALFSIAILITTGCVYLSFHMNNNEYNYVCTSCHQRLVANCKTYVQRNIKFRVNSQKTQTFEI